MLKKWYTYVNGKTLYTNSLNLMINTGVLSISGFLFWLLAARLYTPNEIGIATTLFSAILMISGISTFGLNAGLLRYIPQSKSFEKRFNSSIILASILSLVFAFLYLVFLPFFSPNLVFIRSGAGIILSFFLFTIVATVNELLESVFLALKKTTSILQKTISYSVIKLVFPFFLISFGAYGIVLSIFVSMTIALFIGFAMLYSITQYRFKSQFSKHDISDMATYSFGSFISAQISNIPIYVLPILITAKISAAQTAFYFIAASIANFLFIIPKVVTQNLLVESSHDEKHMKSHVFHTSIIIISLFVPLSLFIIFFGQTILTFFGNSYSNEGFALLRLLTVAALFGCINTIYGTIFAVKKQVKLLVTTNALYSGIVLFGTFFYLAQGIISIGYVSIVAQIVLLFVNINLFRSKNSFN